MSKKKTTKKIRGKYLTTVIVVSFFARVYGVLRAISPNFLLATRVHMIYPYWYLVFYLLSNVISSILIVGIWKWKKMAVYLDIAKASISGLVVLYINNNYFFKPLLGLVIFLAAVEYVVVFYSIYRKWKYFE